MRKISSADNPRVKALHKLAQSSRERRRQGLSLLDGIHLVEAYREHLGPPREIMVSESGYAKNREIQHLLSALDGTQSWLLPDGLFNRIAPVATPTGIVAIVPTPRPAALLPRDAGPCVLLEDLQDPGNLGSILRSAAAASIKHVFLSPRSVQAWSPRVLRAGMGAHFMLSVHESVDLIAFARGYDGKIIGASHRAHQMVYGTDFTGKVALLFGNEGAGLSDALADAAHALVAIPMPGPVESLNVAAAAAVFLFERVRQIRAAAGDQ